jgi:aminobenzoyl-glutamate transport protein
MTVFFLPVIWLVTDRVIEPRLGTWEPEGDMAGVFGGHEHEELSAEQRKGLRWAGFAALGVVGLWAVMTLGPGTPLITEEACKPGTIEAGTCSVHTQLRPMYSSLVAAFFLLFLGAGYAYGLAARSIANHRDLVKMMADAMKDMGYYLVLAFAAAHFVAMFGWSNLGLISAIHGANGIEATGLPLPAVLGLIVLFSAALNIFIGSASAKWALLAPVLVPMLMLLGVSPEGATAAYRVGDSATNIITPLMVYFPLILVFAQRWKADFGLGSLTAMMIPYSLWIFVVGLGLTVAWVYLGIPLGPDASVSYSLPGGG